MGLGYGKIPQSLLLQAKMPPPSFLYPLAGAGKHWWCFWVTLSKRGWEMKVEVVSEREKHSKRQPQSGLFVICLQPSLHVWLLRHKLSVMDGDDWIQDSLISWAAGSQAWGLHCSPFLVSIHLTAPSTGLDRRTNPCTDRRTDPILPTAMVTALWGLTSRGSWVWTQVPPLSQGILSFQEEKQEDSC